MIRTFAASAVAAAALVLLPAAAVAQGAPQTVSAADPEGIVSVMNYAGYEAELVTDPYGDPKIDTRFGGWGGSIWFYGCNDSNAECDALQFVVGFDREAPLPLEMMNELVAEHRMAAIYLDEDGDPWIKWDVVTEGGIPASVFKSSLRQFSEQAAAIADEVFAEERAAEEAAESGAL